MKKILWLLVASILLLASCQNKPDSIQRIVFPQLAAELHGDVAIQFQLDEKQQALLGQELPLFRIVSRRDGEKNAGYYDGGLFKLFAGNLREEIDHDEYVEYRYENGDELEIYQNGSYCYWKGNYSTAPIKMSDEEAIKIANEYLINNALLPEGFTASNLLGGEIEDDHIPLMKSVGFFREIQGYEVWGRSDIEVQVRADGVSAVISIYSDYEFEKNVACLSYEEVKMLDPIKTGQIVYEIDKITSDIKSIVLNDVKIMYYDSPVNQPELTHIQPIYQFTGTITDIEGNETNYYWTIQAVSDLDFER